MTLSLLSALVFLAGVAAALGGSLRKVRRRSAGQERRIGELLDSLRGVEEQLRLAGSLEDVAELSLRRRERLEMAILGSRVCLWEFELADGTFDDSRGTCRNVWEMLGYPPSVDGDGVAGGLAAVTHPEDLSSLKAAARALVDGSAREWEQELRVRHRDGSDRWLLARGVVTRHQDGRAAYLTGTGIDITAERALRDSEERFRAIFENRAVGMALIDRDGHLLQYNDRFCEFFGYARQSMVGRAFEEYQLPSDVSTDVEREKLERGEIPSFTADKRFVRRDGSVAWGNVTTSITQRDAAGRPARIMVILQDIATRKALEVDLQATKDLLDLGVRSSNVAVFDFDMPGGKLEDARPTTFNTWEPLGYDPASAPAGFDAACALAVHPGDLPRVRDEIRSYLEGERPHFELECRVVHQNGALMWRLARGVAFRDRAGKPTRFIGSHVDITGQKLAEEQLRESEHRWRSLAETLPHLVWTATADGTIDYLSTQATEYTGRAESELLGTGWAEAIHPEELGRTAESWYRSIAQETSHEVQHRLRRWDGQYRWFTTRAVPARNSAGQIFKWIGTSTDITDLKRLEEDLQHAKQLLETGIRGSNVAIFDFDMPDGRIENARQTMINVWETLGHDPATVPAGFIPGAVLAIHPDDLLRVQQEIGAYLASSCQTFEAEYRVRHRDGSVQWRLARGTALRDEAGKPVRFLGSFCDITEQKRVEDKLRESEQRWRTLAEAVPHLVFTSEPDGSADYLSAQSIAYLGRTEGELRDSGWLNATHHEDRERVTRSWLESVETGRPHEAQHRIRRWDGEYRWMTTRIIPLRNAQGDIVKWFGTSTDITTLKQLEEELRHSKDLLELGVRGSKVSIFEFDMPDGQVENARQTMINLWESLGYDPAAAPTRFLPGSELAIHPEDLARVRSEIHSYLNGEHQVFEIEFRVRHRDGAVLWHLARGLAYRDPAGIPRRFIGSFIDITDQKRVEEQHRASEQHWRTLAETLPQLVWSATASGAADYFSVQAQEFTGVSEADLVGAGWLSVIHPDDHAPTIEAWSAAIRAESLYSVGFRIRRADGAYRWFATRATPLRDSVGRVFKWVGTCTDIEEDKQLAEKLRESEQRWQSLAEMMPHFVWTASADGLVDYYSAQAPEYTGLPVEELHGNRWAQALHPEDRDRTIQAWSRAVQERRPYEVEHRVRGHDGAYQWFSTRAVPLLDGAGRAVKWFGTNTNVEGAKRIEADLLRAREVAEAASRAKDEFLANVSHEIRTPMNAILGMTELALDAAHTEHQRQLLSTVRTAARNLLNVINDLLDFSKINAGKLALDEANFSLRAALGDTVRSLAPRAHRKGLRLTSNVHADVPDALWGDAGRLRQVLMNLMGNALKFTAQGEVAVEVTRAAGDAADDPILLSFAVRDTGIGIAREKQEAIFRAFEQEDASTTRKYGGTGLGLTISAQLAALMAGEITVESEPGRGSTFRFLARFARSTSAEAVARRPSPERLENLRVLVVDDDEANRRIMEERLTNWRMHPTIVGDGSSALDALAGAVQARDPYPLVFIDGRMPDVDGVTLAAEIRRRFGPLSHRVVLLSSDDGQLVAARSREAGVRACLLKPVQASELLETIWAVMNSADEVPGAALALEGQTPPGRTARPALRILVAEDNELNVALLRELLTQNGQFVEFATDGRAALALARARPFDLLLLDLHMPELDGFEVAQALRQQERVAGGHLPIIALTARSSSRDRERCLAIGMDDFLSKPIEADALWSAIDRMLATMAPARKPDRGLLDRGAITRACGGRDAVLRKLSQVLEQSLPDHMSRARAALERGDWPSLSEAAHTLYGTLAAFSTSAGALALQLEAAATRQDAPDSVELVERLAAVCPEILEDVRGLAVRGLEG